MSASDLKHSGSQGSWVQWQWYANGPIRDVEVEDIDNDGNIEIVVGSEDGNVYALTATGEEKWHYYWGEEIWSLAIADFDSNGQKDVLVGAANRETLILLSAGGERKRVFKGYGAAWRLMAEDLNCDQNVEILVGSRTRRLHVLSSEGRELWEFDASPCVLSLALADIDKDGTVDILVGSENKSLYVLDTNGSVVKEKRMKHFVMSLSAADIDGDGGMVIAVGCADHHLYLLSQELEEIWSFETDSWVRDSLIYDVDGDGEQEILFGTNNGTVHILTPQGQEKYRWEMGSHIRDVAVVDAADMSPIILVALDTGWLYALSALRGRTDESVVSSLAICQTRELAEMLEESTRLIAKEEYRDALAHLIRASEFRTVKWEYETDSIVRQITVADINRDGKSEILVTSDDRHLRVLSPAGDLLGKWSAANGRIRGMSVVDINGDGKNEILVASGKAIYVLTAALQVRDELYRKQHVLSMCVSDIDADGVPEIVVGTADGSLSMLTPNGEEKWSLNVKGWITSIKSKDINNDREEEIVATSTNHHLYILSADGTEITEFSASEPLWSVSVVDVDRDGRDEILVISDDGNTYVLSDAGREMWRFRTNSMVESVTASDIDGDGEIEILVGPATDDYIMRVLNYSGQEKSRFRLQVGDRFIVVADIDGDCVSEYLVGSRNKLYVLEDPHREQITERIDFCWERLCANEQAGLLLLDENEDLRAYVATRLSKTSQVSIQTVRQLAADPSIKVRKALAANLPRILVSPELALEIVQVLHQERDEELRRIIGHTAASLIEQYGFTALFSVLEHLSLDTGLQVRQNALLQLAHLSSLYPKEVFQILVETCQCENDWTLHETSRVLVLLFESNLESIYPRLKIIIERGCKPTVLNYVSQVTSSQSVRFIATYFHSLLIDDDAKHLASSYPGQVENICRELARYAQFNSLKDISSNSYLERPAWVDALNVDFGETGKILDILANVSLALSRLERVRSTQDRVGYLNRALTLLDAAEKLAELKTTAASVSFHQVINAWHKVVRQALDAIRGLPRIQAELRNKRIPYRRKVQIVIDLENNGTGLAEDLCITLHETHDYAISGQDCQTLEILPSGGEGGSAFFWIRPRNREVVGISATLSYRDLEGILHTQGIGDRVEFIDLSQEFVFIHPNPYVAGRPLREEDYFVGRRDIIEFVKTSLVESRYGIALILYGERRCGKTSILYRLQQELPADFVPVVFDMQRIGSRNISSFLSLLAKSINQSLSDCTMNLELPLLPSFSANPFLVLDDFLDKVETNIKRLGLTLVLMLDEFEVLEDLAHRHADQHDLLGYLRNIVQHRSGLSFIFAGGYRMKQLARDYSSELFNVGRFCKVDALNKDEAKELVTKPVKNQLTYDRDAIDRISEATGCQPYLIQFVCHELVIQANKNKSAYVSASEVNIALAHTVTDCTYFDYIWETLASQGMIVVSALASTQMDPRDYAPLAAIQAALKSAGVHFERRYLMEIVEDLVDRDILLTDDLGYKFKVDLVRLWVRRNQSVKRVANRYLW